MGRSTDSKPTTSVLSGAEFYETDTGRTYNYIGSVWVAKSDGYVSGPDTLTTANTYSTPDTIDGFQEVTYALTVSSIADTIRVRIVGKLPGGGWVNLDADGDSTIVTADGDYMFRYNGGASISEAKAHYALASATTPTSRLIWYSKKGGVIK